ncbi:MAG: M56 family metallopeptidase [Pseudomonadales bacterium]
MTEVLTTVVQVASIWLVATLLSSLLTSLFYSVLRRLVGRFDVFTRAWSTLFLALSAPLVGLSAVLIYFFPAGAQLFVIPHCHAAACDIHAPLFSASSLGSIGLFVVTSLILGACLIGIAGMLRAARRRLSTLFLLARQVPSPGYMVVESEQLFAWCCGLLRHEVVVSRALLKRLDAAQLQVVLAHEQAHATRFDNLRKLLARLATTFWLPAQRRRLVDDVAADCEACCHAQVAKQLADPAQLADVLAIVSPQPVHEQISTRSVEPSMLTPAGVHTRPVFAYLLLAGLASTQMIAVAAASHPLVEVLAALGG